MASPIESIYKAPKVKLGARKQLVNTHLPTWIVIRCPHTMNFTFDSQKKIENMAIPDFEISKTCKTWDIFL